MTKSPLLQVASIVLLLISTSTISLHVHATSNITCEQVTFWLTPCISYGVMGGIVLPGCCSGIKALNAAEKTNEDIRTACYCIKDRAAKIPGLNYDRVNELPNICGTTCPFKLTPSLNCSKFT